MAKTAKHIIIGSTEAYSGKSATIIGLAAQAQAAGLSIAYGKPIGPLASDATDSDVTFIQETLALQPQQVHPTLVSLSADAVQRRVLGEDTQDYQAGLDQYQQCDSDLVLIEGPATLREGTLFDLSVAQIAQVLDAEVLLVFRYKPSTLIDDILAAQGQLGDRLCGVVINNLPEDQTDHVDEVIRPFLEAKGIPLYGVLPYNELLLSVSVKELVHQLDAEVLCRGDRLNLMVGTLKIGAMNVNSALKYFRKAHHMAVVTGGDRTDLQLAALETSTHCLILTGHIAPTPEVLQRADDLEVPILAVDLDTLTTVEIIERAFGQVRLHEAVKVQCIRELVAEGFDLPRLLEHLGVSVAAAV
ncbi:MAG: phosphotransacetylase family protein [Cyanobacteria bacterium P01_A01_bin.135]